jgi:surface polysaccharide O-acyltransferase-like enzyme
MRDKGLDSFRLIACFFVISLHVGRYSGLGSEEIGAAIRLAGRWAVPFFFMLSGYFLARKSDVDRAAKPLYKSTVIFIISTFALLPLVFFEEGITGTIARLYNSEVLLRGSYHHLWYLSSAVTGFLIILTCEQMGLKKFIPTIAILSLISYLVMGSYNPVSSAGMQVARHFSSIGCMFIGMLMRGRKPNGKVGIILCTLGFVLQEGEAHVLNFYFGYSILEQQFLIGTLLFSIGIFDISRSYGRVIPIKFSEAGADHSLFIYVFHPYAISAAGVVFNTLKVPEAYADLIIVPIVFICTLVASVMLVKINPTIHRALNGNCRPLGHRGQRVNLNNRNNL